MVITKLLVEHINDASKNPKHLWTNIKSILHSSPPNEQFSPPISQSLANSLASFFYQKYVSLKDSIALKLHGSPTPFDFDLPHSGEVQARTQDFLTGGYKVFKSPSQPNAARGSGGAL